MANDFLERNFHGISAFFHEKSLPGVSLVGDISFEKNETKSFSMKLCER